MPDKEEKKAPDEIDESLRAAGVPEGGNAEPEPIDQRDPMAVYDSLKIDPKVPRLNRLEFQRFQENSGSANMNALQLGAHVLQIHQLEEQKKELLNKANNIALDNNRLFEGARKRLKLPDEHNYGFDARSGVLTDQGPKQRGQ